MPTRLHIMQNAELDRAIQQRSGKKTQKEDSGMEWRPLFIKGDPYTAIEWEKRDAKITRGDGSVVFEQKNIEVPSFWSQTAIDIVASKYFRGQIGDTGRETSVKQLVDRVAKTIAGWGFKDGYFKTQQDHDNYLNDLRYLLINQFAAFNSPVWFNVGVYERPQCSACFILSVEDSMESILKWYQDEGWIFKFGSGSGTNLSKLRSSKEPLSHGGFSSGPVSFMKGADGVANSIRSGGTTRRAAKMVVLNADHPDIKDFIYSKKNIEDMVRILESSGVQNSLEGDLFTPYTLLPYQNANNSVRVTDEFMKAVENDEMWELKAITTGETLEQVKAKDIMDWIADAAWQCADPGIQFDTTINNWHTCPNSGRINASNPCSEYMHLDNSACNLASINLLKLLKEDGSFDIALYRKTIRTMILAQDIIVGNSFYPTNEIAKNANRFRTLGLGYANLGALLMTMGLAYDSDEGRTIASALTSILSGEAYMTSTKMSSIIGAFEGYDENREAMLRVIRKHRNAAESLNLNYKKAIDNNGLPASPQKNEIRDGNGTTEGNKTFTIENRTQTQVVTLSKPTERQIMKQQWVRELLDKSEELWQKIYISGERYGFRNAQVSVLAPTGTISFLMDCDTTGIEPELALVKYKKLVGGGTLKLVNNHIPTALQKLGYSEQEIKDISAYILEEETIEGAPHIKEKHLPIFDCSFKPKNGSRSINYMGHIKMMSAVQPFISGAISKTVNMPYNSTREDIKEVFMQAWKLGLKAIAIYRDGSKSVQPMNTSDKDKKLVEHTNGYRRIKLPDERRSITHKFSVGKHEGYLTIGLYPDTKKPAETFIRIAKEGSTVSGLMDVIATLTSVSLQSGVPLKTLVKKFKNTRFEPLGPTNNDNIPFASSFIDYIFTYLGHKFLNEEDQIELFGKILKQKEDKDDNIEESGDESQDTTQSKSAAYSAPTENIANLQKQSENGWNIDLSSEPSTDAPTCECGTIMFRTGSCYSCPNCFATTGVCN